MCTSPLLLKSAIAEIRRPFVFCYHGLHRVVHCCLFVLLLCWKIKKVTLSTLYPKCGFLFPEDFPKERVPVVLAPLLYKEERDQEEVSFR